jgi:hypothetical protein
MVLRGKIGGLKSSLWRRDTIGTRRNIGRAALAPVRSDERGSDQGDLAAAFARAL